MVKILIKLLGEARGNATYDVLKNWGWPLITTAISGLLAWAKNAPVWQVVGIVCVISYAFAFWLHHRRDQKNKKQKPKNESFQPNQQSQKKLIEMVDRIKAQKRDRTGDMATNYYRNLQLINPIGELIKTSNEIQTESELRWFCTEFEKHGYAPPLKDFQAVMGDDFQWLPILIEARHRPEEIKTAAAFLSFLALTWSGKERWNDANSRKNAAQSGPVLPSVKPLKLLLPPPIRISKHTYWEYAAEIEIQNENQSVSHLTFRITNIDPPFLTRDGHGSSGDLQALVFPLKGNLDRILHQNQRCRVRVFEAQLSNGITLIFKGEQGSQYVCAPQIQDGSHVQHILEMETAATGVPAARERFKIIFRTDNQGPPARLERVDGLELIIHSADWWIHDVHSDVTKIVHSYLVVSKIKMSCEVATFGDPQHDISKILTIEYSVEGERKKDVFREHDIIALVGNSIVKV